MKTIAFLSALLFAMPAIAQPPATYRIAGTVVDSVSGRPLSKTRVLLETTAGSRAPIATYVTGQDGRFVFAGLSAAKYSLAAERQGYPLQGLDRHDQYATAVAVGTNLDSESIVFHLLRSASIDGRVTDDADEPQRGVSVLIFMVDNFSGTTFTRLLRTIQTDDLGIYHAQGLLAGRYFVAVSAEPWFRREGQNRFGMIDETSSVLDVSYPVTFFPGVTDWHAAAPINLKFGQRVTADVPLRAVHSIHVRLSYNERRPPQDVRVLSRVFNAPEAPVPFNRRYVDGALQLVLAPGHYTLEVSPAQESKFRADVDWNGDLSLTSDELAAAPHTAAVSGAIKFDGDIPDGVKPQLALLNVGTRAPVFAPIDADGNFTFPQPLPLGTYEAHIARSTDFWVWGISAAGGTVNGTRVAIDSPGAVRLSVVATRSVGNVDGVVTLNDKPKAGSMVVLVPQNEADTALYRRDQSDSDGTFTLRSVLPGDYVLLALDNWEVEWSRPEVIRRYLAAGQRIHVSGDNAPKVSVQVQPVGQ